MRSFARHTATRLALVVSSALSMLLVVATPALASDVVIRSLDAVCAEDGSDGITFAVTTDRQGEAAEHPAIRVEWKPAGLDDDNYVDLGTGPLTPENGYTYSDTVTGLDFGDASSVTVRATALKWQQGGGPWGDGRPAGDTYTRTISVESCGDGDPGENARMNFTAGCTTAAGEPAAILFNDGTPGEDAELTFDLTATFGEFTYTESVDLAPGESTTVLLVFTDAAGDQVSTEDGTVDVRVDVAGDTILRSIDVDCEGDPEPRPDASVDSVCGEDGGAITATLDNPTAAPVTFVVTIDGDVVDTVEVAAGDTVERDYAVGDGTHVATVEADSAELADATLTVDCLPDPAVDVATECFNDVASIELTLANPDAVPTTFVVTIDGEVVDTIEVAGDTAPASFTVLPGVYDVVVTADGVTVLDETVNAACAPQVFADATTEVVCAPDGGRLIATVDNPDRATTAQLLVDGELVGDVDAPSLALTELVAEGLSEGPHEVVVVVGGATLVNEVVDVDCVEVQGITDSQDPDAAVDTPDTIVAGEQLPAAGAESVLWVLFALLLVFFGGDLVLSQFRARLRRAQR